MACECITARTMANPLKVLFLVLGLASVACRAAWVLSWSDDFDGPSGQKPDESKWGYDLGGSGWGNNELECYTDSASNAALDGNGNLLITARSDDASQYQCWYGTCEYTSARLLTKDKFSQTYGRFEARIQLPYGKGVWPAFWMLGMVGECWSTNPWPNCGETDIVEMKGSDPTVVMGTIHGPGYSGSEGIGGTYTSPTGSWFSDDFHIYAVEWLSDSITWYVDDVAYNTVTPDDLNGYEWVFDHDFFMIINFAVGGNFDGDPAPETIFPQSMTVDYIHVYVQQ